MKRKIVQIDEEKCNGCGDCIPECQEGALQIIDEKARLISDLFCDGLGACLGHCPEDAITIIEREAEPYDELKVMEMIVPKGRNTILAHLEHLRDHNEVDFLNEAIEYLNKNNIDMSKEGFEEKKESPAPACGCPGSATMDFNVDKEEVDQTSQPASDPMNVPSELRQWPVQMHLVNPQAPYFRNADVVLTADCVPFAMGNFHARFLKDKSLAIACPKLDASQESYVEKLTSMIKDSMINSLTVIMMEVPCCGGLLGMAEAARQQAGRNVPIKRIVVSLQGEVLQDDWA